MQANDYQVQAMRTASTLNADEQPICAMLGLIGEVGELAHSVENYALVYNDIDKLLGIARLVGDIADKIKKHLYHGHALDRMDIERQFQRIRLEAGDRTIGLPQGAESGFFHVTADKELGDVQWYVALAATARGRDLSDIMQDNIDKLKLRYPDGFSSEASQNRSDGNV